MEGDFFLFLIGGQVVMTTLAWIIGASRGRGGAGFLCGFLLGPLGVIIAFFLPPDAASTLVRSPEAPVQRQRKRPLKRDPIEEFEAKERAKTVLNVPEHLRGRKVDED